MTALHRYTVALACHPETPNETVQRLEARVHGLKESVLTLSYALKGDLSRLAIPPPGPPRRAEHLWEHTCFEIFLAINDSHGYYEFNFSPSGEWAAYAFRGYRDGAPIQDETLAPAIAVRMGKDAFELEALLVVQRLAIIQAAERLRLGLSAVIENNDGRRSYWALKHPPGQPDFHHPDNFALEIEPDLPPMNEMVIDKR